MDKAEERYRRKKQIAINQERAELEEKQADIEAEERLLEDAKELGDSNLIATHERRLGKFKEQEKEIKKRLDFHQSKLEG